MAMDIHKSIPCETQGDIFSSSNILAKCWNKERNIENAQQYYKMINEAVNWYMKALSHYQNMSKPDPVLIKSTLHNSHTLHSYSQEIAAPLNWLKDVM